MENSNKNDVWKVHILSTSWWWWWRLRLRLRLLYIIAVTVLVLEITLKRAKPLPGDQISRKMAEKCRHLWTQQTGGFLLQGQLNSQKAVSEHLYKIRDPTELTRFCQKGPCSYFLRGNIIPIWFPSPHLVAPFSPYPSPATVKATAARRSREDASTFNKFTRLGAP